MIEISPPKPYCVIAQLTENSPHPGATDKGYRYVVCHALTLDAAKEFVRKDIESNAKPDSYGGLIDWGRSAKREYAIFKAVWEKVE